MTVLMVMIIVDGVVTLAFSADVLPHRLPCVLVVAAPAVLVAVIDAAIGTRTLSLLTALVTWVVVFD